MLKCNECGENEARVCNHCHYELSKQIPDARNEERERIVGILESYAMEICNKKGAINTFIKSETMKLAIERITSDNQ